MSNNATNVAESSDGPIITWAKNNPLSVATLLGGAIYVLVFQSYRDALRPFGVTPAEVGIDYTAAVWPVVKSIAFLVLCVVIILAIVRSQKLRAPLLWAAVFLIPVILIVLAVVEETQYRNAVAAGKAHSPFFRSWLQVLPGLRAARGKVVWMAAKDSKPPLPTGELLFLGTADGVTVLYSAESGETLHVPTGEIILAVVRTP